MITPAPNIVNRGKMRRDRTQMHQKITLHQILYTGAKYAEKIFQLISPFNIKNLTHATRPSSSQKKKLSKSRRRQEEATV
jgi:hypothetical protein